MSGARGTIWRQLASICRRWKFARRIAPFWGSSSCRVRPVHVECAQFRPIAPSSGRACPGLIFLKEAWKQAHAMAATQPSPSSGKKSSSSRPVSPPKVRAQVGSINGPKGPYGWALEKGEQDAIIIGAVTQGGVAERAGLTPGLILVSVNRYDCRGWLLIFFH